MKTISTPGLKRSLAYFLTFLMAFYATSCYYFKYTNINAEKAVSIYNIGKVYKQFIVHVGSNLYYLKNLTVDTLSLSGSISPANDKIFYKDGRSFRIKAKEDSIIHEVHLYLNPSIKNLELGVVNIPLRDIYEIRMMGIDHTANFVNNFFGTVGVTLGVMVIIGIVLLLTKSSCPYIYVNDGEKFVFEGEVFGGAIAQNLVREDYLPLPSIRAKDGYYRIQISDELKERQYTDLAQLMVVQHPQDSRALLDKSGKVQILQNEQQATSARSYDGTDIGAILKAEDRAIFLFNNENFSQNGIYLNFKKPANATQANLVLNTHNTLWGDYLFGEFISKFGVSFDTWMANQNKLSSAERIQRIRDNDFPLNIYIKQNQEWKLVDYLFTVGPLAPRDVVIPIDLSNVESDDVEIKLETGFMFWEMDYAAMDFTPTSSIKPILVNPSLAMGTGNRNWTNTLNAIDDNYMIQKEVGEITEILYPASPPPKGMVQSVFLHTRGYYELIREYKGAPQIQELIKFKTPGYFSDYSRTEYLKFLDKQDRVSSLSTHKYNGHGK